MSRLLFSIGEASRISGLSVKALRLYQERKLLLPSRIDADSGYRYYTDADLERAQAIRTLRDFDLSLEEIGDLLQSLDEGGSLVALLERTRSRLTKERERTERSLAGIDALLKQREKALDYLRAPPPIVEKLLPTVHVATIRTTGRYADASIHFPTLFAACGPAVAGPPFELLHEAEYREEGADLSFCVPVAANAAPTGVARETLPEIRAATLVHAGSWDSIGLSWSRLLAHVHQKDVTPLLPLRETYLRPPTAEGAGPWLTELAVPFREP